MSDEEQQQPLLQSDHERTHNIPKDVLSLYFTNRKSTLQQLRHCLQHYLLSKYGHYFVMILVTLDVAGILADFLISLHICEHNGADMSTWRNINEGLGILSLVFSCLFVAELLCSIFAFGPGYFRSKFHCFDATAIIVSFLVDVVTHGPVKEAGSLIIILRLFRVFKIVEESSTVATETVEGYEEKIKDLRRENADLRQRLLDLPHILLGEGRNG